MEAILRKEVISGRIAVRLTGLSVFIVLTTLGAFVRIPLPFSPVPVTLQTFFVLLAGASLGSGLGALSQAGYMLLGAAGVTVFTGAGSGLLYLSGPTGGYLAGFIAASFFIGCFIGRAKNLISVFALFCLASATILACGVLWLKVVLGYSFLKLMLIGFLPFVPGDMLKALFAAAIYMKLRTRLKEIF